jgi:hypothetical protein
MYVYSQSSGQLTWDGALIGTGYSGHGPGLNNGAFEAVSNVGPIPKGLWDISGPIFTSSHGPYAFILTPAGTTETYARSGFLCHGDEIEHAGEHLASEGCIILSRDVRNIIGDHLAEDNQLTVIV